MATKQTKSTSTRTGAKKTPAKKTPSKKAPAKKAAAKTTTTKRTAARTTATKSKAPAKKTAAKKAPAKKTAAKKKSPFSVRDRVVYPHHGAAIIKKRERIEMDGEKVEYFVIEAVTNPLTLRIPVDKAVELGLRPVISRNAARKVFSIIKEDPVDADATWARWFKLLQDKMSSGDIYEVAAVVRDLTYAQQSKPLGPALKRMLAKARLILTSELQLALDIDEEAAIKKLDRSLVHLIIEEEEEE